MSPPVRGSMRLAISDAVTFAHEKGPLPSGVMYCTTPESSGTGPAGQNTSTRGSHPSLRFLDRMLNWRLFEAPVH